MTKNTRSTPPAKPKQANASEKSTVYPEYSDMTMAVIQAKKNHTSGSHTSPKPKEVASKAPSKKPKATPKALKKPAATPKKTKKPKVIKAKPVKTSKPKKDKPVKPKAKSSAKGAGKE
ncbi:Histone H1.0 [Heterocephalus glaber]|uniref:Histone H1.0 n=1 Tax=Heterocephalus glaber TaxID=10181 RepID=G5BE46_HETGA|nr:Histone H1.0 [Heterocephalus glaber]